MGKVTEIFGLTVVVLSLSCVSVEPSIDSVDHEDAGRIEGDQGDMATDGRLDVSTPDSVDQAPVDGTDSTEEPPPTDVGADQMVDGAEDLPQRDGPLEDIESDNSTEMDLASDDGVTDQATTDTLNDGDGFADGDLTAHDADLDTDTTDSVDAADSADTTSEIDLGPESCASSADCLADGAPICVIGETDDGGYATSCEAQAGVVGAGGSCSGGITADLFCQTGYCMFDTFCAAPCESSSDCERGTCDAFVFTVDDRGTAEDVDDDLTQTMDLCVPIVGSLTPCDESADCPDEICGLYTDSRLGMEERCEPPNLLGNDEGRCELASECATSVCIGGSFCYWACNEDADCTAGDCYPISLRGAAGVTGVVKTCLPTCKSDEDCRDSEFCDWYPDNEPESQLLYTCEELTGEAGLRSGAECGADAACRSGSCSSAGRCVGVCDPDTDAGCATGTFCYEDAFYINYDPETPGDTADDLHLSLNTCLPDRGSWSACETDRSCAASEACVLSPNSDLSAFQPRCRTNVGSKEPGEICADDTECRSGSCNGARCFGLCGAGAADICQGGTTCVEQSFQIDFFGNDDPNDDVTGLLHVCVL